MDDANGEVANVACVAEKPNQEAFSLNLSTSAGHATTDTLTTNILFLMHQLIKSHFST